MNNCKNIFSYGITKEIKGIEIKNWIKENKNNILSKYLEKYINDNNINIIDNAKYFIINNNSNNNNNKYYNFKIIKKTSNI